MPWGVVAAAAIGAGGAIYSANKNSKTQSQAAAANDPIKAANAQAAVNRVNQYTPYGSSTWQQTGTNPDGTAQYSNFQNLSPAQQQSLDYQNQQNASLGQAGNNLAAQVNGLSSTPFDTSGAGAINYGMTPEQQANYSQNLKTNAGNAAIYSPSQADIYTMGDPAQATASTANYGTIQNDAGVPQEQLNADLQAQRDAYYKQQQGFLDPQWQEQQQALATQLSNSGVAQNSEAYNKAMDAFNRQREFAYNNARQSAIQAGGAEQTRLQNMALAAGAFHNAAQNQGFNQSATNAQMQNQINLANMAAKNNAAQFDVNSLNQGGQFNANSLNQGGQFNAGAMNNMGQFNANLNNQALNQQATTTLANAQQNNAAQAQAMQQLFQLRNQPLNELSSLRSSIPIASPNYTNTSAPNINMMQALQNQYQNTMANANNQAAGTAQLAGTIGNIVGNTNWGSLFNLGGGSSGTSQPSGGFNNIAGSLTYDPNGYMPTY